MAQHFALSKPSVLRTDSGFAKALHQFEERVLAQGPRFERELEEILKQAGLLERFVAKMTVRPYSTFRAYLKESTADMSAEEFMRSLARTLLERFSQYFQQVEVPFQDLSWKIGSFSRSCAAVLPALAALQPLHGEGKPPSAILSEIIPPLPSKPFRECGVEVPRTHEQAGKLAARLLRGLTPVLMGYLDILREGRLSETIVKFHIAVGLDDADQEEEQEEESDLAQSSQPVSLSLRRTAVLESIEGHGPWKITVSTRFIENLRTSKTRPSLFAKIKTILQELSQGNFAGRNQLPLTSNGTEKAVYLAYLTKYCSLVYHILNTEIRVFGIYAANSLEDSIFWDAVGTELAGEAVSTTQDPTTTTKPSVSREVADKVRFLVVLDRFVELSKSIMQRIMNDEDVQAVFELSPQEEEVVEHDGSCYVLGRSGTGKTTIMLFRMLSIEAAWTQYGDVDMKPRQIFLTRSQPLADKVSESFARLHETHVSGGRSPNTPAGQWDPISLPVSVTELQPCHFPLFLSFDNLCSMLEYDLSLESPVMSGSKPGRKTLLTYDIFLAQFWAEFRSYSTRGMDPFLVYGEIIGVIKGSEETLNSGKRYLDKASYIGLSARTYSTFATMRETVYQLFEEYKARQQILRHVDIADRTHAILEALNEQRPSFLKSVDFIYVDEAQDNLLIDTLIMRSLCKNPDGLLWAGDTAQTIFAGSSFTFNTLKAFMYRREEMDPPALRSKQAPAFFRLTTNFRSSGGIVACSQTLLEILTRFWPTQIDHIPREMNISCGVRPYFFKVDIDAEFDLRKLISESNKQIEFGAEQCVLVRDDEVREALQPHLPQSTLLLTLYESKGLEFNDVLLWNFFEDSKYTEADWDMLKHALHDGVDDRRLQTSGLRIELLFLYVAVTRAKHRLWIVDNSRKASAMQTIWQRKGEVELGEGNIDLSQFALASAKDVWAQQGRNYFKEGRYKLAIKALRMAELAHEADVAEAFYLRERVELMSGSSRLQALKAAADAFLSVGEEEESFRKQAEYFATGADCFLMLPDIRRAAESLVKARSYTRAVTLFRDIARFKDALDVIKCRKHEVDRRIADRVVYASRLFYVRELRFRDVPDSTESHMIAFIKEHGLYLEKAKFFEHVRRLHDASTLYLQVDQFEDCLRVLDLSTELTVDAQALVHAFWREPFFVMSEGRLPKTLSRNAGSLVRLLDVWEERSRAKTEMSIQSELHMFRAMGKFDMDGLRHCGCILAAQERPDHASVLASLHRWLQSVPAENTAKESKLIKIAAWLETFYLYIRSLRALAFEQNICDDAQAQRLFGFTRVSLNDYALREGCLALLIASQRKAKIRTTPNGDHLVTKSALSFVLHGYLIGTLKRSVQDALSANDLSDICCTKKGTTAKSTQLRLRILCQSILVEDVLRGLEPLAAQHERERSRLEKLYWIFTGSDLQLSTSLSSALRQVPEGPAAMVVLAAWIRDCLPLSKMPTPVVQLVTLSHLIIPNFCDSAHILNDARSWGLDAPRNWRIIHPAVAPLHDQRGHYGVNNLLDMIEAKHPWSLHSGVLFLTDVVRRALPIDGLVLCNVVDHLVAIFSVALTGQCTDLTLLPSCASLVLPRLGSYLGISESIESVNLFVQSVGDLLQAVLPPRQKAFILVSEKPLQKVSDVHKIIVRLCQSLGVLGSNVNENGLRNRIVQAFACLRAHETRIADPLCRRYAMASTWVQFAAATKGNIMSVRVLSTPQPDGSSTYRLVHSSPRPSRAAPLRLKSKAEPDCPLFGPVTADVAEFRALSDMIGSFLDADCSSDIASVGETPSESPQRLRPDASPDALRQEVLTGRLAEALESTIPGSEELVAIWRVQSFIRARLVRQRRVPKPPLADLVAKHFDECCIRASELPLLGTVGRILFRGPLPQALACLDCLHGYFECRKEPLSKELRKVAHIDLEEAGDNVMKMEHLRAKTAALIESLGPESGLYKQYGWEARFREYIGQVEDVIREMETGQGRSELESEWLLVRKSVLYAGKQSFIR